MKTLVLLAVPLLVLLLTVPCYGLARSEQWSEDELHDHPLLRFNVQNVVPPHASPRFLDVADKSEVSASPTSGLSNRDFVTVKFSNPYPTEHDFIVLYNPAGADVTKQAPVKYVRCNETSSNYLITGSGTMKFELVNMRQPYRAYLITDGLENATFLAQTVNIEFANYNAPMKPRLTSTNMPAGQLKLLWSQKSQGSPIPTLEYWNVQNTEQVYSVQSQSDSYNKHDLCGAPATTEGYRDAGVILNATFRNLKPGHTYAYKFGNVGGNQSPEYMFTYPKDRKNQRTRLAIFGDMGARPADKAHLTRDFFSLNTSRNLGSDVAAGIVDAVYHIGDLSYARGYQSEWEWFFDQIQDVSSQVAWNVVDGNHERDWPETGDAFDAAYDSGGECGVPATRLFQSPAYYSHDMGNVHIIMMSTEIPYTTGTAQNQWLMADLAAVNRTQTPWVVFCGHRPMYIDSKPWPGEETDDSSDHYVSALLIKHVEPLLLKYNVDVAFWGHHHSYQRMCAMTNSTCESRSEIKTPHGHTYTKPGAPVHLVVGTAGAGFSTNLMDQQPSWAEQVALVHGYTRLDAQNKTHLRVEFVNNADASIFDAFWINKA